MVKYLLDNHSRVNFPDIANRNALIFAVKNGNQALVRLLLMNGADPTMKCDSGLTAHIIAKGNNMLKHIVAEAFIMKIMRPLIYKRKQTN